MIVDHVTVTYSAKNVPLPVFMQLVTLVELNLKGMYEKSTLGWSKSRKKREMKEDGTRYIVIQDRSLQVLAFCSYQIVIEDDMIVAYL